MEEDYQQCQQVIAEMLIDIREILIKIEVHKRNKTNERMIKKCVICGGEYEAYDKVGHSVGRGIMNKSKRPHNSKTCSKKCARKYAQQLNKFRGKNEI